MSNMTINPMAACLKTGASLGGIDKILNKLEELFGTTLVHAAPFVAVALAVAAIFMMWSHKGGELLKLAVIVALIPFGVVLLLTVANELYKAVSGIGGC